MRPFGKLRRRLTATGLGLGLVLGALPAAAGGRALEAVTLGAKARLDGLLREWPARLDALDDAIAGGAQGGTTGAIGYDEKNVYVALKVKDRKLVRTSEFGDGEDHAVLEIVFPTGGKAYKAHLVKLYPGVIGKSAGSIRLGGTQVKGARLIEAPADGGYTVEASIPWVAFPEAARARAGLRAALRYADYDAPGSRRGVVGTSGGSGQSLPPLLLEAEQGLHHLLKKRGISTTASKLAVGDIAGDGALEVVAVYGNWLTVLGGKYREGKEFFFQEVSQGEHSGVTRFDVLDMTGDAKDEIVLGKRVGKKDEYREVVQILRVENGDSPFVSFQHETGIVSKEGEIKNEVSLKRSGGKVALVVAQGKFEKFDPATYAEPMPADMDSALLPWQTEKSRSFEWSGKGFAAAGSEAWQPAVKAPEKGTRESGTKAVASAGPADGPPQPPPPRPPSPEEMLDRVYALYRQDRKMGAERPRFDFVTDVAADRTPERVLVHQKDIVVFGKAFKEGTSYAFITIGVESPKDIVDVTARDLTGDGKAEIIVRGVLHAKASKEMGGKVVDRHGFFVYQATEGGVKRIFAAETGRSLGDDAIVGGVRFVPRGKGVSLELAPSRAVGWTEKTYPFPVDKLPYGGLEPLLVPWGEVTRKRYRFDGSAFVADE